MVSVLVAPLHLNLGAAFVTFSCRKVGTSLIENNIQRCSKRRELDDLIRSFIREKGLANIEMWEA